mgnify:CR=1 FL=1
MTRLNTDQLRALLGIAVTQGANLLVLLDAVSLDIEELAAINAFVGTLLTLGFLVFKAAPTA